MSRIAPTLPWPRSTINTATITLPADYAREHVQLAYATTEHGAQGDTSDRSITLATTATTGRGLYVGMTRGRDVLAIVEDGLQRAEQLAAPTRSSLDDLRKIINDHHQSDSTRQILDGWNDLEGVVDRADELCQTLDRWNRWADGREVSPTGLLEIAVALRDHQELPGISQIGESLARWAEAEEVDLAPTMQAIPTLGMGIEL